MQSRQTKPVAVLMSSSKPQLKSRAKDDVKEKNREKKPSAEEVMVNNPGAESSKPKHGKTAWHMERWLNQTSAEEAWSVHGRF
ncbi:hypothetical protein EKO04_004175 [Ascochyta lentis]|uniref:Uncharacterized protein n=1 Tax=Ascochyta lentis TaxID=205686 RepID=A0A8H7J6U7_9PLEO|nr:hypothetical protein EKO04_004175 [Ascochyta lentis]